MNKTKQNKTNKQKNEIFGINSKVELPRSNLAISGFPPKFVLVFRGLVSAGTAENNSQWMPRTHDSRNPVRYSLCPSFKVSWELDRKLFNKSPGDHHSAQVVEGPLAKRAGNSQIQLLWLQHTFTDNSDVMRCSRLIKS